jgi:hypothetical protein
MNPGIQQPLEAGQGKETNYLESLEGKIALSMPCF